MRTRRSSHRRASYRSIAISYSAHSRPAAALSSGCPTAKRPARDRLNDIRAGFRGSYPAFLTRLNNQVLFAADDGATGIELWRTDGTAAGTERVKDIHGGREGSMPTALTHVGNAVYFIANDGMHGFELWKSNGTAAETTLVADIAPGATRFHTAAPHGSCVSTILYCVGPRTWNGALGKRHQRYASLERHQCWSRRYSN